MRTLYEIVEAAKDNEPTSAEECRHAMLVLSALLNMTMGDLDQPRIRPFFEMRVKEAHNRYKIALNTDPKQYLGDDVPENPAYQQFRAVGKKIVEKALAGELPTQQKRTP